MSALTTTNTLITCSHIAQPARRSGVALVLGGLCRYGAVVKPADAVLADFDQHHVTADGLYLLEVVRDGAVAWMGCRRIAKGAAGGVRVDQSGGGDWMTLASLEAAGLRLAGRVNRVLS